MRLRNQFDTEDGYMRLAPSLQALLMRRYGDFDISPGFFDRAVTSGRTALGMTMDEEWTESLESWCHSFVQEHLEDPAFVAAQRLIQKTFSPSSQRFRDIAQLASPVAANRQLTVMEQRIKAIKRAPASPTIGDVLEAVRENSKRDLMKKEASQSSLHSLPRKPVRTGSNERASRSPLVIQVVEGKLGKSKRDLMKKEKSHRSLKEGKSQKSKRDVMKKEESQRSIKEGKRKSKRDLLKKEKSKRSLIGKDNKSERDLMKKEKSRRSLMDEGNRHKSDRDLIKKEKAKRSLVEGKRGKSERDLMKKDKSARSLMDGKRKKSKDSLLEKDGSQRSLVEGERKKSKRDLMKKDKSQMSLVDGKRKKSRRDDLMKKEESQGSLVEKTRKRSKRDLMKKEESLRSLHSLVLKPVRKVSAQRSSHNPITVYATKQPNRHDLMRKEDSQRSLHSLPPKPVRRESGDMVPRTLFVGNALESKQNSLRNLLKKEESQRSLCTLSRKSERNESSDTISRNLLGGNTTAVRQSSRRSLMKKDESQSSLHSLPKKPVRSNSDRSDENMAPATHYILEGKRERSSRDLMKKEESQSSLPSVPKRHVRSVSDKSDSADPEVDHRLEGRRNKSRRDLMKKEESQSSLHSLPKMPVRKGSNHERTSSCERLTGSMALWEDTLEVEMPPLEPMMNRIVVVRRSPPQDTLYNATALSQAESVRGILRQSSDSGSEANETICLTETMNVVRQSLIIKKRMVARGAESCDCLCNSPSIGEKKRSDTGRAGSGILPPHLPAMTGGRRSDSGGGRMACESNHVRPVTILTTIEDNDSSASSISFESCALLREDLSEDMNPERWSPLARNRIGKTRPGTPFIRLTNSFRCRNVP